MPINPLGGANQPPNGPTGKPTPPPMGITSGQSSGLDKMLGQDPDFKAKFNENLMNSLRTQMDHEKKYHEQQKAWRREMNPDSEK